MKKIVCRLFALALLVLIPILVPILRVLLPRQYLTEWNGLMQDYRDAFSDTMKILRNGTL
jgi:hypothetical protein